MLNLFYRLPTQKEIDEKIREMEERVQLPQLPKWLTSPKTWNCEATITAKPQRRNRRRARSLPPRLTTRMRRVERVRFGLK